MARPRDPEVDTRILKATRRLLESVGFDALTVERIAAEAGVGKPAFYRRYTGKNDVVMSLRIADSVPTYDVDTGSFEGDILAMAETLIASLKTMPRSVAGAQIGLAIANEEEGRRFLEDRAHAAIDQLKAIWDRGVDHGEVDPELDFLTAKIGLGSMLIFSILLYRLDPDGPEARQVVRQWVRGVSPVEATAPRVRRPAGRS